MKKIFIFIVLFILCITLFCFSESYSEIRIFINGDMFSDIYIDLNTSGKMKVCSGPAVSKSVLWNDERAEFVLAFDPKADMKVIHSEKYNCNFMLLPGKYEKYMILKKATKPFLLENNEWYEGEMYFRECDIEKIQSILLKIKNEKEKIENGYSAGGLGIIQIYALIDDEYYKTDYFPGSKYNGENSLQSLVYYLIEFSPYRLHEAFYIDNYN